MRDEAISEGSSSGLSMVYIGEFMKASMSFEERGKIGSASFPFGPDLRERRRRSRSPERRRSPSPTDRRRGDERDRGARTPPMEDVKKDLDDRERDRVPAQTPPYDH